MSPLRISLRRSPQRFGLKRRLNGRPGALNAGGVVGVGHEVVPQSGHDRWIWARIFTGGSAGEPTDVVLPALSVNFERLVGQAAVDEADGRLGPVWDQIDLDCRGARR